MSIKKFFFKKISLWVLLLAIFLGLIVTIFFGSSVIRSKNALRIAMIPSAIKEIFFDKYDVVIKEKRFNNKQGLNLYLSHLH